MINKKKSQFWTHEHRAKYFKLYRTFKLACASFDRLYLLRLLSQLMHYDFYHIFFPPGRSPFKEWKSILG